MHDLDPWIRQQKAEYFELPLDDGVLATVCDQKRPPKFIGKEQGRCLFQQVTAFIGPFIPKLRAPERRTLG